MAKIRMKRRDFLFLLLPMMIGGFVVLVALSLFIQYRSFKKIYLQDAHRNLQQQSLFIQDVLLEDIEANRLERIQQRISRFRGEPLRITLIDPKGVVAAESDSLNIDFENHREREEILHATAQGVFVTRYSQTMQVMTLYYAVRLENQWVLRTALPMESIQPAYYEMIEDILLSLLIGVAFVVVLCVYLFGRVRPDFIHLQGAATEIANGNLDVAIQSPRTGLIRELSTAIVRMATQLKAQIKDLKRLEQMRSEFIANVSHEIKTPLTAISSTVEMLMEMELTEQMRERCLDILGKQSRRLNNLVQDILSLASIERRQAMMPKDFKRLSIASVVKDALNYHKEEIEASNIKLLFSPDPLPDLEVMGDRRLLEHLFGNLIANALRYANATTFSIAISQTSRHVKVTFSDDGCGIAEEHLPRLFERFYRVEKERSRATGGTGLGLAIVKHIAILHRGKVIVSSELEKGTSFTLSLRRAKVFEQAF
jgi:two-component system phosphate regulon sensor histidine kinase PhoR